VPTSIVPNGSGDDTAGWLLAAGATLSTAGGAFTLDATSATRFYRPVTTEVGVTYRLTAVVPTAPVGGYVFLRATTDASGGPTGELGKSAQINAAGTLSFEFTATGTTTRIAFVCTLAGTYYADDIRCTKVAGFPAVQSTHSTYRPTLVRLSSGFYGVSFDATDYLATTIVPANGGTQIAAFQIPAATGTATMVAMGSKSGAGDRTYLGCTNTNRPVTGYGNGFASMSAVAGESWSVLSQDIDGPAGTATRYLNGAVADAGLLTGDTTLEPGFPVYLGALNNAGSPGSQFIRPCALWAQSPAGVILPAASRIAIERFGAFLAGAPYTG
jgi:hypothetical protein